MGPTQRVLGADIEVVEGGVKFMMVKWVGG